MNDYERKLHDWITTHHVDAKIVCFEVSCHSVADAAKAVGGTPEEFVKNICFLTDKNELVVVIVKGENKVDKYKVREFLLAKSLKIASPETILERTAYPCGGTPSFGYAATFLVDKRVLEKDHVYSGGGSPQALVKISVKELLRANSARTGDFNIA